MVLSLYMRPTTLNTATTSKVVAVLHRKKVWFYSLINKKGFISSFIICISSNVGLMKYCMKMVF